MSIAKPDAIASAIRDNLSTPNELDSNLEPANVVDAIFALARAVRAVALQMELSRKGERA